MGFKTCTKTRSQRHFHFHVYVSDDEPPTIECMTPQIFYADKGLLTASSVFWEEPIAHDNFDENPIIKQTKGPNQNTTLSKESTYVSYVAKDTTGNESPECSIELRRKSKLCLTLIKHFKFLFLNKQNKTKEETNKIKQTTPLSQNTTIHLVLNAHNVSTVKFA